MTTLFGYSPASKDATFRDSHALWVQHASGTFAQVDLRRSVRPIDAIPRVSLSWNVGASGDTDGALAFVSDKRARWEVPYDDMSVLFYFLSQLLSYLS
jgi:hypothetical protein